MAPYRVNNKAEAPQVELPRFSGKTCLMAGSERYVTSSVTITDQPASQMCAVRLLHEHHLAHLGKAFAVPVV